MVWRMIEMSNRRSWNVELVKIGIIAFGIRFGQYLGMNNGVRGSSNFNCGSVCVAQ